jgi:ACR3 family arsenite transporter
MNKMKKAETFENKLIPFFSSAQIVFLSLAIVASDANIATIAKLKNTI